MNCVLYARVSTDKQADKELSIPAQLRAMRDYAARHQWAIAGEYVEAGVSAKTADRPQLQRLLQAVRASEPPVEVVLVHKIDRLARNVYDHATIKAMLHQHRARLASVVENVDDSVSGQLVENIMASIAQFYSGNLSDEVKKGMRQKVLTGGWPHLSPCGYVSVRTAERGAHVQVHPKRGPLVRLAFELYATGYYSMRSLAAHLFSRGLTAASGRPIPQAQMRRILTNPFYIGELRWNGTTFKGAHEPLVSNALFQAVGALVESRYRTRGPKDVSGFPLKTVAICGTCRGRMTSERHGQWNYYRCSRQSYRREACDARFTNAAKAHADAERILRRIQISATTADNLRKAGREHIRETVEARAENNIDIEQELTVLDAAEMTLTKRFTNAELTPAQYAGDHERLRSRRARVEAGTRQPVTASELVARLDQCVSLATSFRDLYHPMSDARRAELVALVFATLILGPHGVQGFILNRPFDEMVTCRTEQAGAAKRIARTILDAAV